MSLLAQQTPANTQSECVLSVLLATGPAAVGVRADLTQIISSVVGSVRPVFLTRIWTPLNFLRSDWLIFVFSLMMASITYISLDLLLCVCVLFGRSSGFHAECGHGQPNTSWKVQHRFSSSSCPVNPEALKMSVYQQSIQTSCEPSISKSSTGTETTYTACVASGMENNCCSLSCWMTWRPAEVRTSALIRRCNL